MSIIQHAAVQRKRLIRPLILVLVTLSMLARSPLSASAQTPALGPGSATNDATNVTFNLSYSGSYTFFRVYIDADHQSGTGFATGGIGADYLLENGTLFSYTGHGSDWSWQPQTNVTYTNTAQVATWTVARGSVGGTGAAALLFQVEAPLVSSVPSTYVYTDPPIYNQRADNTDTTVTYQFSHGGTFSFYRVYIDADRQSATGFATTGIGADYLLENGSLYVYTGHGADWSWQMQAAVSFTTGTALTSWTLPRAAIGRTNPCTDSSDLVFQVEGSTFATSPVLQQQYVTSTTCTKPKLAVPTYFSPGSFWPQLESAGPSVGIAIINPANGPGQSRSADYAAEIDRAKASGIRVLGYVSTSWAGTVDHSRTLDAAKHDIDSYEQWYPAIDGILLDETSTDCATRDAYYLPLHDYIKTKGGASATVVINPGTRTQECYLAAADIIIDFEGPYSSYQSWHVEPTAWERQYPANRFWHLVYATAQADLPAALTAAQQQNASWVYVTPDGLPNPWDTLPTGTYWSTELQLIPGS